MAAFAPLSCDEGAIKQSCHHLQVVAFGSLVSLRFSGLSIQWFSSGSPKFHSLSSPCLLRALASCGRWDCQLCKTFRSQGARVLIGTDRSPLVACDTLSAPLSCRQQHISGCVCSCGRCSRRIARVPLSPCQSLIGHALQKIMAHGGAANADAHADGRRAGLLATHASSPSFLGHRTRSQSGCPLLRRRRADAAAQKTPLRGCGRSEDAAAQKTPPLR